MPQSLDQLLSKLDSEGKICPQPTFWSQLWELLPGRKRAGAGWEPAAPLILAAWHHTTDMQKRDRFILHLQWAADHNALPAVSDFLNTLTPDDWHIES